MATRYENIINKLDQTDDKDLRICKAHLCACNGCCGYVGAKKITERELEMYKSGEMAEVISKGD